MTLLERLKIKKQTFVDLVIPDTTYLEKNADRVKGILITHGHEDHIGAIPYVLRVLNVPIYGTRLSLGIIEGKLIEHGLEKQADLRCVASGDTIKIAFDTNKIHLFDKETEKTITN